MSVATQLMIQKWEIVFFHFPYFKKKGKSAFCKIMQKNDTTNDLPVRTQLSPTQNQLILVLFSFLSKEWRVWKRNNKRFISFWSLLSLHSWPKRFWDYPECFRVKVGLQGYDTSSSECRTGENYEPLTIHIHFPYRQVANSPHVHVLDIE